MKRLTLCAVAVGLLMGAAAVKDDSKKDKDRIKGNWTVVAAERGGQASDEPKGDAVTFDGEKMVVKSKDRTFEATYTMAPDKKPRQFDITPIEGPEKGKVHPGIYVLDKDSLKICFAPPGEDRPTDFTTKAGSHQMLAVLQREK